jgi:capsular exopolysaccharide synthesis family protein
VADLPLVREQPDPVAWIGKELKVDFNLSPEIREIGLSGDRPEDLATLANAVTEAYLREVADKENNFQRDRFEKLKEIYNKYDDGLRTKRQNLRALAESAGPDKQQVALVELTVAQRELSQLKAQLKRLQAESDAQQNREKAVAEMPVPEETLEEYVKKDEEIKRHQKHVAELDETLRRDQEIVRKETPSMTAMRDELKKAKEALAARRKEITPKLIKQIREETARGLRTATAEKQASQDVLRKVEEMFDADVARLGDEIRDLNKQTVNLESLKAEIAQADAASRAVGDELEKLRVELNAPARIWLLEAAESPRGRDVVRQGRLAGLAGLAAFGFVLIGVAWCEFRARRVSTADDVARGLGLRLVGQVPARPARARRRLGGPSAPHNLYWHRLLNDSIDATRTMLLHSAGAGAPRVVMVTSALPGEGKTSLASQLSISLARAGRRTLLVDCDLRKPAVHRLFSQLLDGGISEVLRGQADPGAVARPTAMPGLSFVSAGQCDEESLGALARDGVAALFGRLKEEYDFVVVDSSPVLCAADSLLLGCHVDAVLFSVLHGVSTLPSVYAAYERLEMLNVNILGAVVNGVGAGAYGPAYYHRTVVK